MESTAVNDSNMKILRRSLLGLVLAPILLGITPIGHAQSDRPVFLVNFSAYDIDDEPARLPLPPVEDMKLADGPERVARIEASPKTRWARRQVDFKALKRAGVLGAVFRSSVGVGDFPLAAAKHGGSDRDVCFDVWAGPAAEAGMMVGIYHYMRQGDDLGKTVDFLRQRLASVVNATPALKGKPILIAIDAGYWAPRKDLAPAGTAEQMQLQLATIRRSQDRPDPHHVAELMKLLHERHGIWPVFYPENGSKGQGNPDFESLVRRANADDRAILAGCPMWVSHPVTDAQAAASTPARIVHEHRSLGDGKLTEWARTPGSTWDIWQFSFTQDRPAYLWRPASKIALESNVFHGSPEQLKSFWAAHGWVFE